MSSADSVADRITARWLGSHRDRRFIHLLLFHLCTAHKTKTQSTHHQSVSFGNFRFISSEWTDRSTQIRIGSETNGRSMHYIQLQCHQPMWFKYGSKWLNVIEFDRMHCKCTDGWGLGVVHGHITCNNLSSDVLEVVGECLSELLWRQSSAGDE